MPVGLDLRADPIELTAALVDIPSESRHEQRIADEIEAALREQASGYEVVRNGDAVLARTNLGRRSRVLLAGHTDTVPAADNLPSRLVDGELHGCGTSDMKSGDAVFLHLAATIADPAARHHAGDVRLRGDRVQRQRPRPDRARTARLAARRRRDPRRAVRGIHRGGLSGHHPRRRQGGGHPGAFGAIVVGRQRHSQARRGARPAVELSSRAASTSTGARTARGSRPCASTAGSRAT